MGANTFQTYADGADIADAFHAAVEQARYDHGHRGYRGYTGTIAEKDEYVVIEQIPMTVQAAESLAEKLIRDHDTRIDDTWGPAGAIAVRGERRIITGAVIPENPDGYDDLKDAAAAAVDLAPGETIVDIAGDYRAEGRSYSGTLTVITTGSPQHTGWLFFGSASS